MKQLIAKRKSTKVKLTIFRNFLENIEQQEIFSFNRVELKARLERLIETQNSFDEIQVQIEDLTNHSDDQLTLGAEIENTFFNLIARAKSLLETCMKDNEIDSKIIPASSDKTSNQFV